MYQATAVEQQTRRKTRFYASKGVKLTERLHLNHGQACFALLAGLLLDTGSGLCLWSGRLGRSGCHID
jgi:hypothetical protein